MRRIVAKVGGVAPCCQHNYHSRMAQGLPGWVKENASSVREEAADYVSMTPSERARLVRIACATAMAQLEGRADREAILRHVDPLPEDSRALLARLRARARRHENGSR